MLRRIVLCALLAYVSLDLSLPMMPGAFVFEPADSIDGTQSHGRRALDVVVIRELARAPVLASEPTKDRPRLTFSPETVPSVHRAVSLSHKSTLEPTPPPEEPH
jgi:hypothetical protein